MPEWLKGADCKSAGFAYVGSNPTRPIKLKELTMRRIGLLNIDWSELQN